MHGQDDLLSVGALGSALERLVDERRRWELGDARRVYDRVDGDVGRLVEPLRRRASWARAAAAAVSSPAKARP